MRLYWLYLRNLLWLGWQAVFLACVSLPPCLLLVDILSAPARSFADLPYLPTLLMIWLLMFAVSGLVSALIAFIYGVPLYAWLSIYGYNHWFLAVLIGVIPGWVLFALGENWHLTAQIYGATIGALMHWLARDDLKRLKGISSG